MKLTVAPGADGVVRIGPAPVAASYLAEVELPGMTVLVDPTGPDPAAHALVHDTVEAEQQLELLFGGDAARAVARGEPATVPRQPSAELAEVERLGWLSWLDRYRPVPLDDGLLRLELAVTRADLPGGEPGDDPELEQPDTVAALVGLARAVRETPQLPLAGQLRELLRTAFLHLPVVDDGQPLLAHERELLQLEDGWGGASLTAADLTWLAAQLTPTPAHQLGGATALAGRASLDWRRVPRALLPAAEDTVSFRVAEGRVAVAVEPPPRVVRHPALAMPEAPQPGLVASLRSSTWPLPLAEGGLAFDLATRTWRGDFAIAPGALELAEQAELLDVDVRSRALGWRPRSQRRARESAARRWAARGVAGLRLSAQPGAEVTDAAVAALRFAARLWNAAGRRDRAERCLALIREPRRRAEPSLAEEWLLASGGGSP